MKIYTITLAAGAESRLDVEGEFVLIHDADNSTVLLSLDGESPILVERGLKIRRPFRQITVQNPNASAVGVDLLVGRGDVEDYRTTVKPQIASSGRSLWQGLFTGNSFGTSQLVEAANAERVMVKVIAPAANTGYINLWSSQTAGAHICWLYPGQVDHFNYKGALYVGGQNPGVDNAIILCTYY